MKGTVYSHNFPPERWNDNRFIPPFIKIPRALSFKHTKLNKSEVCEDLIAAIQCALDVEENCRGLGQKRGIHCIHFSDKPDLHSAPIGPPRLIEQPGDFLMNLITTTIWTRKVLM